MKETREDTEILENEISEVRNRRKRMKAEWKKKIPEKRKYSKVIITRIVIWRKKKKGNLKGLE